MPMTDIAVLVVSFDGYADLWDSMFACFFKYWPDCPYQVFLGTNDITFVDERVTTIRIGPERDYSSNLLKMLEGIPAEWVLLLADDVLLSGRADTGLVRQLVACAQRRVAGHVRLAVDPPYIAPVFATSASAEEDGICEMPRGAPYRVSIGLDIYRRQVLERLVVPGESVWALERKGTLRSQDVPEAFYCVSRRVGPGRPFRFVHGIVGRRWTREAAAFLRREGLAASLAQRPVAPLWHQLRVAVYSWLYYVVVRVLHAVAGTRFRDALARFIAVRAEGH